MKNLKLLTLSFGLRVLKNGTLCHYYLIFKNSSTRGFVVHYNVLLLRIVAEKVKQILYTRPRKYIHCSSQESAEPGYINILELAESMCRYDLDDMDIFWLQEVNEELAEMGEKAKVIICLTFDNLTNVLK